MRIKHAGGFIHFSGGATPRSSCPVSKHLDGHIFTLMLHELMYDVRALIYLKYMMMTVGGSFGYPIFDDKESYIKNILKLL